jgi:hypothetical protein
MINELESVTQMGRPKIAIPMNELTELMAFFPTLEETASWFDCSPDSIERIIKDSTNITFAEFRQLNSGKTRLLIKRKAITKALEENNDKMLLYCLRTMTDLDDRIKIPVEEVKKEHIIKLCYSKPNKESN